MYDDNYNHDSSHHIDDEHNNEHDDEHDNEHDEDDHEVGITMMTTKKWAKSRRCVGGVGVGQIHLHRFSSYISFRIIVTIIWIVRIIIVMITIIIVETHDHHGVHISQLFME